MEKCACGTRSCVGDPWVSESPFRSECPIKSKRSCVVCVSVLKCLGVRHRTNVIDERVTRPLVSVFSRTSSILLHHLAKLSWHKLSGATVLATGSLKWWGQEFDSVCPTLKYVCEDSQAILDFWCLEEQNSISRPDSGAFLNILYTFVHCSSLETSGT